MASPAAFLNPPANPIRQRQTPPFGTALGVSGGRHSRKATNHFESCLRRQDAFANAKAPATVGGIERRIERDHGLPKGPVSLRNPTVGAEIARLRHLTLACKPFSWELPLSARGHHGP